MLLTSPYRATIFIENEVCYLSASDIINLNIYKNDSHTRWIDCVSLAVRKKKCRITEKILMPPRSRIRADKMGGGDASNAYVQPHIHVSEREWKAGAFSGGALMRMLLIIQFVNSRYILIVHDEPRVTRMTRTATRHDTIVLENSDFQHDKTHFSLLCLRLTYHVLFKDLIEIMDK